MKIKQPLTSASSQARLDSLIARTPHATLLVGDLIANNNQVADWLAGEIIARRKLSAQKIYTIGQGGLTMEEVRDLGMVTKHKSADQDLSRLVVVHDLEKMSEEAQNAILKSIEEPVSGVLYILSTADSKSVISTIDSRCITIKLQTPSLEEYRNGYPEVAPQVVSAAYMASGGEWAAFSAYLAGETEELEMAKAIISSEPYKRLKFATELSKDRERALRVVRYMQNIQSYLMKKAKKVDQRSHVDSLNTLMETIDDLNNNGNVKLLLDKLFVAL